jgi:hypothetical protein
MEVSDVHLRNNTQMISEKSSMKVRKYFKPQYDLFGKDLQTLVYINSNTSVDLDLIDYGPLLLDFDKAQIF